MAKISVDFPNMPKGAELEIPGVGFIKNGSSRDLSPEEVESWERVNNLQFPSRGLDLPLRTTAKTKTPTPPEPPEQNGVVPEQADEDTGGGS